jgi:hypothetical protein
LAQLSFPQAVIKASLQPGVLACLAVAAACAAGIAALEKVRAGFHFTDYVHALID